MHKIKKDTPLSPEELIELIGKKPSSKTSFSKLDDFGKEALEGFEAYSTPEKAKRLMEEIDSSISKRVSDNKSATKNKAIWLSVAASFIFIIFISVFFLNKAKKENSNMALKEAKEQTPFTQESNSLEPPATTLASDSLQTNLNGRKDSEVKYNLKQGGNIVTVAQKKVSDQISLEMDNSPIDRKRDEKLGDNMSLNSSQSDASIVSQEGLPVTAGKSKEIVENNMDEAVEKTEQKKISLEVLERQGANKNKKNTSLKKEKNDMPTPSGNKDIASSAPKPSVISNYNNNDAYYKGGEAAIKDFVLNYIQNVNSLVTLKGKYRIKATVLENGNLKVIKVIPPAGDCKNCVMYLTNALNGMSNWEPATRHNETIISKTNFVIVF